MATQDFPPLPLPPDKWHQIAEKLAFSPQQKRIVELMLRNLCDKQIAAAMELKHPTLRTYITRIFSRTHVNDRDALILLVFAMSHGIR